jgi:3-ketosteroid 9alpha-monooxygenase subunit A
MSERLPAASHVYPRGWFVIHFSDELKPGEVKPLQYFGQELVLFRTDTGDPRILDAFCPHMGAHLGYGAKVQGGEIVCPFHAWRFDGAGKCTAVPYASHIPPRARIAAWPVVEKNGMIYVWNDADGQGPDWEVPDLPEYGAASYSPWRHSILAIKTHPREIVENLVDTAHFMPVHGTDAKSFRNEFHGHVGVQHNEGVAYPLGGGTDHYSLTATYFGPAYMVTHMKGVLESILINAHTPIGPNLLHLRFAVSLKRSGSREIPAVFADKYIENLRDGFLQDVAIWEHKVYRDRPLLCEGDGQIPALRRWYRQFYEPRSAPSRAAE